MIKTDTAEKNWITIIELASKIELYLLCKLGFVGEDFCCYVR